MHLLIQNPGVAPVEGFTLLGVSTTRGCGVEGAIGQFGSGNKHAINVLLRAGLKVVVYCGKTRLDFQTRDDEIDDGLTRKTIKRVMCKLGGTSTRTIDLGWVLDFGAIDWTDLGMALREFISNAIDRTLREENGEFVPALWTAGSAYRRRGRQGQGEGRLDPRLRRDERGGAALRGRFAQAFPALLLDPSQVKKSFLPKSQPEPQRHADGGDLPRGRLCPRGDGLQRTIRSTTTTSRPSELADRRVPQLQRLRDPGGRRPAVPPGVNPRIGPGLQGPGRPEDHLRGHLDPRLHASSWDKPKEEQTRAWQQAWQAVAADAVMCGPSGAIAEFVQRKGHVAKTIPSTNIVQAAHRFGVKTEHQVLSENEKKGREKTPATEAATAPSMRSGAG